MLASVQRRDSYTKFTPEQKAKIGKYIFIVFFTCSDCNVCAYYFLAYVLASGKKNKKIGKWAAGHGVAATIRYYEKQMGVATNNLICKKKFCEIFSATKPRKVCLRKLSAIRYIDKSG